MMKILLALFFLTAPAQLLGGDVLPAPLPPLAKGETAVLLSSQNRTTAPISQIKADGSVRDVPTYGDVSTFRISSKSPREFTARYLARLTAGDWETIVDSDHHKLATSRLLGKYSERWVELRAGKRDVTLVYVDNSFPGETLSFGEGDTLDVKRAKFKGLFALDPPKEGLPLQVQDDFPFLRHFPGFSFRDDLTREADSLELSHVQVGGANAESVDHFVVHGPTITKKYWKEGGGISTFKQFMSYRLALETAGWELLDVDPGYLNDAPVILARYTFPDGGRLWARLRFESRLETFVVTLEKKV